MTKKNAKTEVNPKNVEKSTLQVVKETDKQEKVQQPKPTKEETEQYRKEFETAAEKFNHLKWPISEKGDFSVNSVSMFIENFMKKFGFWTKNGWMGMLKMEEELKIEKDLAIKEGTTLKLGYQALEFCAYMLANPSGIGLEMARDFEKVAEEFSKIGMEIGKRVEEAREELKNIQYLQEKWAAAEQGFYLADLEPKNTEELDESDTKETLDIGNKIVEADIKKK